MAFTVPSLEEMHALLVRDHKGRFPDDDVSPSSDNYKRLRVLALAATALNQAALEILEELMPDGRGFTRWGENVLELPKKAAVAARGTDALRVTGTAGSSVAVGDELVHEDGTRFQVNENATIAVGQTSVDVDVLALDAGAVGNKKAGDVLTFVSPPAGINTEAELQSDLTDGADAESDGAYQDRVLDRLAAPGMGGNAEDYRQWALEVEGVASAYVYSGRAGLGSVDIAVLKSGTGAARVPSASERDAVQALLDERRPVSVRDCRVLEVLAESQDVEVLVTPLDGAEWAFDWDDSTPLVVSSWDANTRQLTFTTDRPDDLDAGDRLIIATAGASGEEVVVESLVNQNAVKLEEAPATTPQNGDTVYSGGPVVEPARQAILDLIDSLGPARGTEAALSWKGTLTTADIFRAVQTSDGILDSEISTPAANVTPTNSPPSDQVGVVVPGRIIVRRKP